MSRKEIKDTTKVSPRDVLFEEMIFFREKANKLGNEIAKIIKEGPKARGDILFQLYKIMLENKERLIDVASKLAPYEHAKLQSVEVKAKVEHRFVVRAPESIKDTGAWMKAIGQEEKEPITSNVATSRSAETISREAEEITDYELVVAANDSKKIKKKNKESINTYENIDDDEDDIIDRFDD